MREFAFPASDMLHLQKNMSSGTQSKFVKWIPEWLNKCPVNKKNCISLCMEVWNSIWQNPRVYMPLFSKCFATLSWRCRSEHASPTFSLGALSAQRPSLHLHQLCLHLHTGTEHLWDHPLTNQGPSSETVGRIWKSEPTSNASCWCYSTSNFFLCQLSIYWENFLLDLSELFASCFKTLVIERMQFDQY